KGWPPIALTVFPGVHHNFDVAQLTPGVRYFGHWLEYNELAAKDVAEKTRAFLTWATRLLIAALAGSSRSRSRNRPESPARGFIRPLGLDPTQGWLSPDRHLRAGKILKCGKPADLPVD